MRFFLDFEHGMRKIRKRAEKKGFPCNILEYSRRLKCRPRDDKMEALVEALIRWQEYIEEFSFCQKVLNPSKARLKN